MRLTLFTSILVASLALAPLALAAKQPLYEVQVLVFANHLRKLDGHEHWNQEKIQPVSGYRKALKPSTTLPAGSTLAHDERLLSGHPHYTILAAASWVQNAVPLRATKAIRIASHVDGRLKGVVRVFQWRLLHVALDLHYTPPQGVLGGSAPVFQLAESRPMALYRTNYFDHPKFGALVLITPYHGTVPARG